jgi:hypothetical protein
MKIGSVQISTKGSDHSVSVELIDERLQTIGEAKLTLKYYHKDLLEGFEKKIVKLLNEGK